MCIRDRSLIKLIAPTTDKKRLKDIIKISSGFLYQVTVTGTTGQKSADENTVKNFIDKIKEITNIPVCTGFGIKTPENAKKMANTGASGVIVGSAIVKYIQDNLDDKNLPQNLGKLISSFVKEL